MLPSKLAFVDVETTGVHPHIDRVIEIGIVRFEEGKIIDTFESLINPHTLLHPEITHITGINQEDLENAPSFRNVIDTVTELFKDTVLVAHNARFDYSFLKNEYRRLSLPFQMKHLCTVRLSRVLYPRFRRHNLDAIIERFGIMCDRRHRALDDAKVLVAFMQHATRTFPKEKLSKALTSVFKRPSLPKHLSHIALKALPESPGVYFFYGENDLPLYIGKSINIRDRVLSHFASDVSSASEMRISQQIKKITWQETAGELGALILESQMIKKHKPLYNRRLRDTLHVTLLFRTTDAKGYHSVRMETVQSVTKEQLSDTDSLLGLFKTARDAKEHLRSLVKKHLLCEKLLGLEKTKHACFRYRLDQCKGACIGEEQPLFYNLRFTTAFFSSKLTPWPFQGPIAIGEENPITGKKDTFLFDKWCFLRKISADEDAMMQTEEALQFDQDTYKILKRYLDKKRHTAIHVLTKEEHLSQMTSA